MEVRSRSAQAAQQAAQIGRTADASAPITLEQLGKKLWGALKGVVADLGFGVPSSAKRSVASDLAVVLGLKAAPTMGRQTAFAPKLNQRDAIIVEDAEGKLKQRPASSWKDNELNRSHHAARHVVADLHKDKLQRELFDLPAGSVLHEDGHLKTAVDNAPAHVEVRAVPYLNTIDDVARFLAAEAKRDGKIHAWEVNGSLIEARPDAKGNVDTKAMIDQWSARRSATPDQRRAQDVFSKLDGELQQRLARSAAEVTASVEASLRKQLSALPVGTALFAAQPESLKKYGAPFRDAPFLGTLDEAIAWVARTAEKANAPIAYAFNDTLLVADPRQARGTALEKLVLQGWEQAG